MSRTFQSVPLVDVAGLASEAPGDRRRVADALGRAAREVGFLYITGHGLEPALAQRLQAVAAAFFAQPLARKMRSYIGGSANHSGYVPEGEEVFASGKIDRKEAYDINLDRPGAEGLFPMAGANLWPDVSEFREAVAAYYAAVSDLARRMFSGFALALGLPADHFEKHLTAPPSQLRLIHYPFDAEASDAEGIGAHTDYECFTILHCSAPGLEVLNAAGDWIDVPPVEGALVVNIGDMLEAWTNGEFVATSHRVRKVAEERFSFPYFATCDYATVVEPLPQFVGSGRPARYPSIVSGEHLFAQTAQTFAYLKQRQAALPQGARALASFGQAARRGTA